MTTLDWIILVFGILLPLVILQVVFMAGIFGVIIIVGCYLYCRVHKAHALKKDPDRLLLREIRGLH